MEVNSVKIRRLIRRYVECYQQKNEKNKEKMKSTLDKKVNKVILRFHLVRPLTLCGCYATCFRRRKPRSLCEASISEGVLGEKRTFTTAIHPDDAMWVRCRNA